jgi:hypothetical protein
MPQDATASADSLRITRRSLTRRGWCDATLPKTLVSAILHGDPGRLLFASNPLQVKDRCVVARHETEAGPLLVKLHNWGGAWRTLRMLFRETAAHHCAELGLHLHRHGILTPRPRAYLDLHFGPWTYKSYLVSDYVRGESLYRYIRFGVQTDDELEHIARQVARIWQRLVEMGASHNDMKPENFIVDSNSDVWLIDLERVRLRGSARRQRERQLFDMRNFLHVRGWHRRAKARAIFADAFLSSGAGALFGIASMESVKQVLDSAAGQADADLSVVIVCDGGVRVALLRQAIDSVRDIADEVVLATPTDSGGLDVVRRLDLCDASKEAFATPLTTESVARYPWVLVLHQNESVTPFLAKELQQRIADGNAQAAFRITLEPQYFGHTMSRRTLETPIRLFQQTSGTYDVRNGAVQVANSDDRIGRLTGTIQACKSSTIAEFVELLNDQSTTAAVRRLEINDEPRLMRAGLISALRFIRACVRRGGIRSGWTGVQIAAIESAFCAIEEAKLYQLASQFRRSDSGGQSVLDAANCISGHKDGPNPPQTKAA